MSGVMVYLVLISALFLVAFLTKRRIGAPVLGLAAGTVLGSLWAEPIASWLAQRGAQMNNPVLLGMVTVCLVLLPAALLMMHGHLHKSVLQRVLSAILFTLVGLAFVVEPLGGVINLDGVTDGISEFILKYREPIITLGLIVAVVDLVLTKLHKQSSVKKGKH